MKNRITIGISSIVLIFLILCLAVFSLLSLSDAKTALSFSQRHAESVRIFYESDAAAQRFIRDYRQVLAGGGSADSAMETAARALPEGYVISASEDHVIKCDIPMENGQTLSMELTEDGKNLLSYYVYNNQEYVIDTRMPVFGGDLNFGGSGQ